VRNANLAKRAFGPPSLARLAQTTAFSSAADAFVAVSLAGSLFFNLSIDAARPRIILYLVLTMAPFAVVAPLLGPVVDRVRGGHRAVIALACVGRALLCLALSFQLRSLALYPLAFSILVLNKTHSVAKSALVPRLVDAPEQLVENNAVLSRVSVVSGAIGGGIAGGILTLFGGPAVLLVGAVSYFLALLMALNIPKPQAVLRLLGTRIVEERELRSPALVLGVSSMALLRGAVGYFSFFVAFTLKALGEATLVFGLVAVVGGLGGLLATFVAPGLRRLLIEERIIEAALILPATVALVVPKGLVIASLTLASFALGMAANVGRQSFDSLVQREAPDAERGRTFARLEVRLQLMWVVGALIPVLVRPSLTVGMYLMGGVLVVGAVVYGTGARGAVRNQWGQWTNMVSAADWTASDQSVPLDEQLLDTARWLAERGSARQAVMVANAAVEYLARQESSSQRRELVDALLELEGIVARATKNDSVSAEDVQRALALADGARQPPTVE